MDYKWYLPSSTPSSVVASFIKHLQPRSLRGRQKEYVTAFAKFYFHRKPHLPPQDLALLLYGDGERKGLVETCGSTKGLGGAGELRGVAVLSLELLLMLLDCSVNTQHGEEVLDVVVKGHGQYPPLPARLAASLRLDRHLQQQSSSREFALKLAFILSESCPQLQGREWIGSADAIRAFDEWQRVQLAAQSEAAAAAAAEDDDRELSRWEQVKLDDLDAEDVQVDAALAELIAEVDAEGEKEGGQKDPLGIARSLPVSAATAQRGEVATSARMGKAAAKKMQILWSQMRSTTHAATAAESASTSTSTSPSTSAAAGSAADGRAAVGSASSLNLMAEVLPQGSTSTDREDFNPTLFLSTVHSASSLDSLQRGLQHLQRSVNNRAAAMRSLVAEHFGQYVFCLDTIEHLHQLMQGEVHDSTSRALRLGAQLQQLNWQCEAAYGGVVAAKRGSDRMRHTLRTLGDYTFLFNLPHDIRTHAQRKQYSQVVRLYHKAKQIIIQPPAAAHASTSTAASNTAATSTATSTAQLQDGTAAADADAASRTQPGSTRKQQAQRGAGTAGDTQQASLPDSTASSSGSSAAVDLPALVLRESFVCVSEVRAALFRQLDVADAPLDEQVQAIQLLTELDADVDPAWYFLRSQRSHIARDMDAAAHAALERCMRRLHGSGEEDSGSDAPLSPAAASAFLAVSPAASVTHGGMAAPSASAASSLEQTVNGHSSSSSPLSSLLAAPWNPFGPLLLLNPAVSPLASSLGSSPSPSGSAGPSTSPQSAPPEAVPSSLPAFPLASAPSFDAVTASAVHHLLHRLCALLQAAIPPFLRLAQLIATRQLSSAAASASASSTAHSLQGLSSEHRQAIHALLDGLFHHFASYVRLALFPLTQPTLQAWQSQPLRGHSAQQTTSEANGSAAAQQPTKVAALARPPPPSSFSPSVGQPSPSSSASSTSSDMTSEMVASSLPLLPPPLPPATASVLPLPPSMWQNLHLLLRCYHAMQELGLSAESLQPLHSTRTQVIRWYAQQHLASARLAVEQLPSVEDYSLAPQTTRQSARSRGRRRAEAASPSSTIRCTSLPSRFLAVLQSALSSLTALSSVRANWVVKLVAAPSMDCMKALPRALHQLMLDALAEAEAAEEDGEGQEELQGREGGDGSAALLSFSHTAHAAPPRPRASTRLLLLLCNLRYTRAQLLPLLLAQLLALFPPSTHAVLRDAFERSVLPVYAELDEVLLQHFLRLHLLALHRQLLSDAYSRAALLSHLHTQRTVGGKDGGERRLSGTRGVVVDLLLRLVHLHADLFHLCPSLIPTCISALFAGVVQSIAYCSQHVQPSQPQVGEDGDDAEAAAAATSAAFWQEQPQLRQLALLELRFIERTLQHFASQHSRDSLQHAVSLLSTHGRSGARRPQLAKEEEEEEERDRERQLSRDVASTAALFFCFAPPQQQPNALKAAVGQGRSGGRTPRKQAREGEEEHGGEEEEDEQGRDSLGGHDGEDEHEEQEERDDDDALLDDDEQ